MQYRVARLLAVASLETGSGTVFDGAKSVAGFKRNLHRDAPAFAPENANRYADNTYTLRDVHGAYFSWNDTLNAVRAWRAFGQDAGSRFHG